MPLQEIEHEGISHAAIWLQLIIGRALNLLGGGFQGRRAARDTCKRKNAKNNKPD